MMIFVGMSWLYGKVYKDVWGYIVVWHVPREGLQQVRRTGAKRSLGGPWNLELKIEM